MILIYFRAIFMESFSSIFIWFLVFGLLNLWRFIILVSFWSIFIDFFLMNSVLGFPALVFRMLSKLADFYWDSTNWLPRDAGSGCWESRNRLQTVLHMCICVCLCNMCVFVCVWFYVYVYMYLCDLRKNCPNVELFLVRISPYLDWIRRSDT